MGNGNRILIVDDDPDLAMATQVALEQAGYQVRTAANAAKARPILQAEPIDLIILDVMMTHPTEGFHFAVELANDDRYKAIPILMLTVIEEYSGEKFDPKVDGQYLPVAAFMRKPVHPQQLLEKVQELLGHSQPSER